ncbi:hypothetical protein AKJ09_05578 [Labilithrix luteola]|uniref:Uncharacterized protein n=1 Tax=Labilithrix luteola TaxID=1391654 RepID=A0A0K1Q0H2_9BACT|nr:hypothetical protein [Labilithrix luteola]AKU98914.1 hypothetical protein AKJ09_05578 [Labilithrix luteola]
MELGPRDVATSAVVALRRELSRLTHQAAAVEKSLDDQRRDRTEAIERLERATEHALHLQARLTGVESEAESLRRMHESALKDLQKLRTERDELAATADDAKKAKESANRDREELRKAREEATKAKAEASKANEEAAKAKDEAAKAKDEAAKAKDEAAKAKDEAAKANEDATKAKDEAKAACNDATKAKEDVAKAKDEAMGARLDAAKARDDGNKAKDEATTLRAEATKHAEDLRKARDEAGDLASDVAKAKRDAERERTIARDKIDGLERALELAKETESRLERENFAGRSERDRIERELTLAIAAKGVSEERVRSLESARTLLDATLAQLRDDVALAFSRAGIGGRASVPATDPSVSALVAPPPPSLAELLAPAVEQAAATSTETSEAAPRSKTAESVRPNSSAIDDDWGAALSVLSDSPPPMPPSVGDAASNEPAIAKVDEVVAAAEVVATHEEPTTTDDGDRVTLVGNEAFVAEVEAEAIRQAEAELEAAPDVEVRATEVDDADVVTEVEDSDLEEDDEDLEALANAEVQEEVVSLTVSEPPLTRRASALPPPTDEVAQEPTREQLFAALGDPLKAEDASGSLREHPTWLTSVPPNELVTALSTVDYNAEGSIFALARAWEREPLCHALIKALRKEKDPKQREHTAWLLKHLAAPSAWKALSDIARNEDEQLAVRRWLLEALDRLAACRSIGWTELRDVVSTLLANDDATIRDSAIGILAALERSDEKRRLLLDVLRTDDNEAVLSSAVQALATVLPVELESSIVERLLGHPSARVQRSVLDFVADAKRGGSAPLKT